MSAEKNYIELRINNKLFRIEENTSDQEERWTDGLKIESGNIGQDIGILIDSFGLPRPDQVLAEAVAMLFDLNYDLRAEDKDFDDARTKFVDGANALSKAYRMLEEKHRRK